MNKEEERVGGGGGAKYGEANFFASFLLQLQFSPAKTAVIWLY